MTIHLTCNLHISKSPILLLQVYFNNHVQITTFIPLLLLANDSDLPEIYYQKLVLLHEYTTKE